MTLQLTSHADRIRLFGEFPYRHAPIPGNPERVVIGREWARENISTVLTPQFVEFCGRPRRVWLHCLVARSFEAMLEEWADAGVFPTTFNGTWVPRFKRQSGTYMERVMKCQIARPHSLSNHSWGTALDVDAPIYPLGVAPHSFDDTVWKRAEIANAHGWAWGGHWTRRPDPMHFEATEKAL